MPGRLRPGLEALHNRIHRFHFLDRNRLPGVFEFHEAAQGRHPLRLIIDQLGILFERAVVAIPARLLQEMHCLRIEEVQLPIFAVLVLPIGFQRMAVQREGGKCARMLLLRLQSDFLQPDASHPRRRPREILIHQLLAQSYQAQGRPHEAVAAYKAALEVEPKSVELLIELGDLTRS